MLNLAEKEMAEDSYGPDASRHSHPLSLRKDFYQQMATTPFLRLTNTWLRVVCYWIVKESLTSVRNKMR